MTNTPDGGPAFPHSGYNERGITIRDYFAGQALAGMMQSKDIPPTLSAVAKEAFRYADAMLNARDLTPDQLIR